VEEGVDDFGVFCIEFGETSTASPAAWAVWIIWMGAKPVLTAAFFPGFYGPLVPISYMIEHTIHDQAHLGLAGGMYQPLKGLLATEVFVHADVGVGIVLVVGRCGLDRCEVEGVRTHGPDVLEAFAYSVKVSAGVP
jgi:hypothetical protein